ncbi:MAG TPA: DUF3105 domain-containing protein [Candidatus Limnocylindria bacterium]|jgi:hypothetical protein|nr:DUF3105 domain-containing protein [Candidatus Limnocylindria bacterium]
MSGRPAIVVLGVVVALVVGLAAFAAYLAVESLQRIAVSPPPALTSSPTPSPRPVSIPTLPAVEMIGALQADEGAAHIPVGQPGQYLTEPPTSGEHWSSATAPAPWGIQDAMLPREVTTHNLEHGGVVIAYNGLTREEIDRLKSLVTSLRPRFNKIVLEPYPPLTDAKVALTSWRWLLTLPGLDEIKISQFVQRHHADREYAPEWNRP